MAVLAVLGAGHPALSAQA